MKWSLTTTPGTVICPTLCDKCVGSFTSHGIVWTVKGCETGPTVYSPYPRRLESLTICGCNYKGSTFSSVILRPWVNSWPPAWQPAAHRCGAVKKYFDNLRQYVITSYTTLVTRCIKHVIGNSATYRAVWLSKSIGFVLTMLHDWLKKLTPIPTQSEATTAIDICSHTFSCASR